MGSKDTSWFVNAVWHLQTQLFSRESPCSASPIGKPMQADQVQGYAGSPTSCEINIFGFAERRGIGAD